MSILQKISLGYFVVLLGAAALNYIPGITDDQGRSFGVFALDPFDDALHLASAIWALAAALLGHRAARMFLVPMLNLGLITPEDAKRVLLEDVVLGETWAQNEVERYTYRMPGQATAYYYGYTKLQALRTQTELMLKDDFDALAFHDFILAQGLLPPELLREAVTEEFVPSQGKAAVSSANR